MSEELGTPAVDAAPGNDVNVSPTLDDDTRNTGPDASGDTDADSRLKELQERLEKAEKRISGQTLSWQQERDARLAHETRLKKWQEAGIDLDEIDRAIAASQGAISGQQPNGAAKPNIPPNMMTREEYANARLLEKWEDQKDAYFEAHPEYDGEEFRAFFDAAATTITRKEIAEYGRILSTPKDVRKKAEEALRKFEQKIAKTQEKKLTETRTKVNSQGVTDTNHRKVQVDRDDDKEEGMSKEDYVGAFRSHLGRISLKHVL